MKTHALHFVLARLRDKLADGASKEGDVFGTPVFDTADGLTLAVKTRHSQQSVTPVPTVVFAVQPEARSTFTGGGSSRPGLAPEFTSAGVEVRNTGATSVGPGYLWTLRRMYPLLGHTLPERQVDDRAMREVLSPGVVKARKRFDGSPARPWTLRARSIWVSIRCGKSPNDPKLSDCGARRAGCGDVAGAGWAQAAGWSAAASVTRAAVRCSVCLGIRRTCVSLRFHREIRDTWDFVLAQGFVISPGGLRGICLKSWLMRKGCEILQFLRHSPYTFTS